MRVIKFRAWDKESEIMHKPNDLDISEDYFTAFESGVMHLYHVSTIGDYTELEIMQYTGLKDKNGVEIYEGDLLYHPLQGTRKVHYPFSEDIAAYGIEEVRNGFKNTLDDARQIYEIVGNIYENPELL